VLKGLQWPLWLLKKWYNKNTFITLQTPVRGAQVLWLVCLCIFLSVCLSTRISPELHVRSFTKFWCMLPTVVARSSSGKGGEVCYLRLPCWYWRIIRHNCLIVDMAI